MTRLGEGAFSGPQCHPRYPQSDAASVLASALSSSGPCPPPCPLLPATMYMVCPSSPSATMVSLGWHCCAVKLSTSGWLSPSPKHRRNLLRFTASRMRLASLGERKKGVRDCHASPPPKKRWSSREHLTQLPPPYLTTQQVTWGIWGHTGPARHHCSSVALGQWLALCCPSWLPPQGTDPAHSHPRSLESHLQQEKEREPGTYSIPLWSSLSPKPSFAPPKRPIFPGQLCPVCSPHRPEISSF